MLFINQIVIIQNFTFTREARSGPSIHLSIYLVIIIIDFNIITITTITNTITTIIININQNQDPPIHLSSGLVSRNLLCLRTRAPRDLTVPLSIIIIITVVVIIFTIIYIIIIITIISIDAPTVPLAIAFSICCIIF